MSATVGFILGFLTALAMVFACGCYQWYYDNHRRLVADYERLFGRPVPIGRTAAELEQILLRRVMYPERYKVTS